MNTLPDNQKSFLDVPVSLFPNSWNTTPIGTHSLKDVLRDIRDGKYKGQIQNLRKLVADHREDEYQEKKKALPAFTMSAQMTTREAKVPLSEKLIAHTNLIQVDIDEIKDIEEFRAKINADPYTAFSFLSPSGGLKAGIRIDGCRHEESFLAVQSYFLEKYEVRIDPKVKEIPRLCFVSYDSELFINEEAQIFLAPEQTSKKADKHTSQTYDTATDHLSRSERERKYREQAISTARLMIERSADGEKLNELLKAASLLGGYVQGGFLSLSEARDTLTATIETKANVKNLKTAHKAIEEGLDYGRSTPIEFEELQRRRIEYLESKSPGNGQCADWKWPEGYTKEPPITAANKTYPLTDFGNAERFATQHGGDVRFCHTWGKWLIWDGKRWPIDETTCVYQLAKATVRKMYAEAAQIEDDDQRKAFSKHARASESSGRIQAMLSLAQTEQAIATTGSALDSNPWLLNVLNGTLDLRTGEIRSHQRQDLITKHAPVIYDPKATCSQWFSFLERIMAGSPELISYLQKLTGYCLTGDTREKCLPVLHGIGDNGKTIFTATIGGMLGDYAQETPVETLMIKKQELIPNDIARLKGARLVTASEGERGQRLAESLIKRLTGGDRISARFLHQEWFEFTPEFKILLSTNHRPIIRGSDNAIWNRIHLVPFDVIIPKSEQIPRTVMLDRLRQEWPGILKWAVEGCLLWQKEGLEKPEEVERATEDYRADSDIIGGFISDCCTLNPLAKCKTADLYAEYEKWCSDCKEEPITIRNFSATLQERGFKKGRFWTGGKKGFQGIGLRSNLNSDQVTDSDPISRVFPIEKNIQENILKNGSSSVTRSPLVICSECANFRPNPSNPSFQGNCLGTPPDEDRSRFPKLPVDCPDFREKAGASCA